MEIHQLRYFIAVAEEGSFSRAAARERVAQPSLSQQIQKLEAEMDQRLFDRLTRSVVLTEAGKCLLEYARKILAEIADARRCVDELKQEVMGRLAVGAIPTIAPYVLPALIGARTLALLREAGATALHRHIKVPRNEVRSISASLVFGFGSRSRIRSLYRELSR